MRAAPRQGQVWWARLPGQPDDPHQPRPVLVVSENVRNRRTDDVMVVPLFSQGALGPTRVSLQAGEGGIRRDSVLFCEEIATIDQEFLVDGPLGEPVADDVISRVIRAVRRALGEPVPESTAILVPE